MSDWTSTRLGDLLRPSNERSSRSDQFPVLTSSRSGLHLQSEYFNRVVASKDNTGYKVIRKGQFTYRAMSDDGFFRFNRLSEQDAGIISPAYEVFECDTHKADPIFMDYLLNSGIVLSQIYGAAQGGTRLSLRLSTLSEFEAEIPPLPEQKKIAEILSGVDRCINLHAARLQVLQNIHNALFDRIPKKADATHGALLGDIIDTLNSGWSPVCPPQARTGSAPAILKTTAITWDGYKPEENKSLPSELTAKDEAIVHPGDILCTRKGPRDRVGVVCYVSDTPPNLMVPDTAFRIRILGGNDPRYISLVLGSKEVQEEWNRKKVGLAEAQVNINHGILKETHIPLPPREMQLGLVNAITKTRERISKENAKILSLQVLKCSLASDLLSGRKRVSI